jgi:hypothetical protein
MKLILISLSLFLFFITNSRIQCSSYNLATKNSSEISCEKTNTCAVTNQHNHCLAHSDLGCMAQATPIRINLKPTLIAHLSFSVSNILSKDFVLVLDRPPTPLS